MRVCLYCSVRRFTWVGCAVSTISVFCARQPQVVSVPSSADLQGRKWSRHARHGRAAGEPGLLADGLEQLVRRHALRQEVPEDLVKGLGCHALQSARPDAAHQQHVLKQTPGIQDA